MCFQMQQHFSNFIPNLCLLIHHFRKFRKISQHSCMAKEYKTADKQRIDTHQSIYNDCLEQKKSRNEPVNDRQMMFLHRVWSTAPRTTKPDQNILCVCLLCLLCLTKSVCCIFISWHLKFFHFIILFVSPAELLQCCNLAPSIY